MNKATKAIRRSSIRLKSFSCGHPELNLIVSDMKDVRAAAKQFANAQETAWKDLQKWARAEKNESIRESFNYLFELNRIWTEVQSDFIEQLNKFKYAFEVILEGEVGIDKLQDKFTSCKAKDDKLRKDLQKATKKNNVMEERRIEQWIEDNRNMMKTTQEEIRERANENEAVKVIRLKDGLLKLSDAYVELGYRASVIFDGKRCIAAGLPQIDQINDRGIHSVIYRGSDEAKQKVDQVKESVKRYKQRSGNEPAAPPSSPPPPYAHVYPNLQPQYNFPPSHHTQWPTRDAGSSGGGSRRYECSPPEDYEQDIAGAVGGVRM